ncbi:hypothetical protein M6I34_12500 [Burkholderiaceae bacterium FT117]|uniref:GTP-binding protein n=1 Tax=Zeimonas sediminis TaxID=2944268 RepID=UPI00234322EE|nr:GTP-binding protein [Zeimonas sediminis]MCM5571330.1 hypothetical protein [Zeimonas sediminis]
MTAGSATGNDGGAVDGRSDPRLPVTVVVGLPGAGKSALISRWIEAAPAGARWALMAGEAAGRGLLRAPAGAFVSVGGCPCCSGRAAFEAALVRLLRQGPWDRLLVELDGSGEPASFLDQLRSGAGARHLRVDEVVAVVDAGCAETTALVDGRRAGAGSSGRAAWLLAAQLEAANRVVLTGCGPVGEGRPSGETPTGSAAAGVGAARGRVDCAALAARLRGRPPFRRSVQVWADAGPPAAGGESDGSTAAPEDAPEHGEWVPAHREGQVQQCIAIGKAGSPTVIAWRWPADAVFDRASLVRLSEGWMHLPGLLGAEAAFRTARDWYLWRFDGREAAWAPTGWRRDSRIELRLDVAAETVEPLAARLQAELAGLKSPDPPSSS